jgi:hypothetical protein
MTLVIEVTPELESRLQEEAAKRGLPVPECARILLEGALTPEERSEVTPPMTAEERAARVRAARGSLAHMPFSSEDFMREKQEEIDREEEGWERRWGRRPG